jgi:tyrosyl-tRNA synthetase
MFKERMNKGNPVSVHEFLYPLMVGYDSVIQDVDCELGGTDQEFNMLAGRTLQKALGKREKFVLTTPLIEGTDGRKMSKSYDNCVYLDDEPSDMFGKMMSINDNLMETYFECCTDIPMDEVKKILKGDPREAKVHLAKEIVRMYHSEKDADAAESNFTKVFSEGGVPDDMPEVKAKKGSTVIDVLVEQGLIASKSEARRLVEQGGIKKDDTAIDSIDTKVEEGIYKVGKRKFLKISL